jgi:ribosomal protein S12 methylthiotransferase accessory factor
MLVWHNRLSLPLLD